MSITEKRLIAKNATAKKQHITIKQLMTEVEKDPRFLEILRKWWRPTLGDLFIFDTRTAHAVVKGVIYPIYDPEMMDEYTGIPLLSVGQMIDFINDQNTQGCPIMISLNGDPETWRITMYDFPLAQDWYQDLCDGLWSTVIQLIRHQLQELDALPVARL